jgi:hypothetical protein
MTILWEFQVSAYGTMARVTFSRPYGTQSGEVVLTHTLKPLHFRKKRTSGPKGLICPTSDGKAEAVPFVPSFPQPASVVRH